MKRLWLLFLFSLVIIIPSVYAVESSECSINIAINEGGKLIDQATNLEYKKDSEIKTVCNSSFRFLLVPDQDYKLSSIKLNDQVLNGELTDVGMQYKIDAVTNNMLISAQFDSKYEVIKLNVNNVDYEYIAGLDKLTANLKNGNLELPVAQLRDYLKDKTKFIVSFDDIKIEFPNGFLYQYLGNTVRINVHEVGENVLSDDQAKSVKNGRFYDFNFFVDGEKKNEIGVPVSITIPYVLEYNNTANVYMVNNEGKTALVESRAEDGVVNFELKTFSMIAINQEKIEMGEDAQELINKMNNITETMSSLDYDTIFTVIIIAGFVIYMVRDFMKRR